MTNFAVQDGSGSTKEFDTHSGTGAGGSPFVSKGGLAGSNEANLVGAVNLIGSSATAGAVRAHGQTVPNYVVMVGGDDGTNAQPLQVDSNQFLKVVLQAGTAAFGKLAANSGVDIGDVDVTSLPLGATVYNGAKTVSTAGTQVALASSQVITHGVRIKALAGNTNNVYVGDSSVSSTTGIVLDAGEEIFLQIANLATVYIDVDTNGEGVRYIAT